MDEAVIKYYRRLLREGFEHVGSFQNPSIYLNPVDSGIPFCGHPSDYLRVYIRVNDNRIDDVKYLCNCDPAANVAVEIMCGLIKGKTLEEVAATKEESFFQVVGGRSKEFQKKTQGLLKLLSEGLTRYRAGLHAGK